MIAKEYQKDKLPISEQLESVDKLAYVKPEVSVLGNLTEMTWEGSSNVEAPQWNW